MNDKTLNLAEQTAAAKQAANQPAEGSQEDYTSYTYDMFIYGTKKECTEIERFNRMMQHLQAADKYTFEALHLHKQTTETTIERSSGEKFDLINMSNYNYLGYGYHPEVIQAAKDALDQFGLGAASTPVISGRFSLHKQLEDSLIDYFGMPTHGVSLFTSGYGVNTGTISAFMKPGTHILLDKGAHMSLIEGAQISRAKIYYFEHNDMEDLENILKRIGKTSKRILICTEGVYSADGDTGNIKDIVRLAKQYDAYTLVDEAHSALLSGKNGRGVCEAQGVLADVDFYIMTFSKAFSAVGGAVLAKKELTQYINWFARCRMFSCALAPAVTGGIIKVLELAKTKDGAERRQRIQENANYMREILKDKVNVMNTNSWIIPVIYGDERMTFSLNDYLQRHGLDVGLMTFPAAPKNGARIRIFVTSEHTREQMDRAAEIIFQAAKEFGFSLQD